MAGSRGDRPTRFSDVISTYISRTPKAFLLPLLLVVIFLGLSIVYGTLKTSQATLYGLVAGSYLGLGAIGLTLIMGVLKLVNLAYGDFLVAGAYLAVMSSWLGAPLPLAILLAVMGTAMLALIAERFVWRPLRDAGANTLQYFLSAMGLAFLIRFTVQFFGGSESRSLNMDVLSTIEIGPLRIGTQQALALAMGAIALSLLAIGLRVSGMGKTMRAVSDDRQLAEVSGINVADTGYVTSMISGLLAGAAGIVYATAAGSFNPNFGVTLLLGLFAAATLGGIGNVAGALVGGLAIGLSQEWSALLFGARWKPLVGLAVVLLLLLTAPRGFFVRAQPRP